MEKYNTSETIAAYLSGDLTQKELQEVEKLISEKQEWQLELEQQKKLLNLFDAINEQELPASMKSDFERMLVMEAGLIETQSKTTYWNSPKMWLQIAASFTILAIGYLIGTNIQGNSNNDQLLALQKEMAETKRLVISSLQNESASARLKAVNTSNGIKEVDQDILEALIKTLNTDKNVNVRIAALEALSQYADQENVRKALIAALSTQDKPTVQIVLINLLVKLNEKRAITPLEKMMNDEKNMEAVRDEASFGVFKLS